MSDVLDRNLRALLTRAYRPVRPREEYVRELRGRLLACFDARCAPSPALDGPPPLRDWRRRQRRSPWTTWSARAAALVALASVAALYVTLGDKSDELAGSRDPGAILAAGQVAWRDGPDQAWRAAYEPETAFAAAMSYLEVATPDQTGYSVALAQVRLAARESTRLALRRVATVALDAHAHAVALDHGQGSVVLVGAPDVPLPVRTSEAALAFVRGEVELAYRAPEELGLDGERYFAAPLAPGRAVLVASVVRGQVQLLGSRGVERELLDTGVHYFQRGERLVLVEREALPRRDAIDDTSQLSPDAADDTSGTAPTGKLAGRVVDAASGLPIQSYVLWLRRERVLPNVATALPHDVNASDGSFAVSELVAGRYRLFVEAPGYAVGKLEADLEGASAALGLELALEPGGSVQGYVVDAETSTPVEGALVIAEYDIPHQIVDLAGEHLERTPLASAITDANGAYSLANLSVGRQQLRVSHPDFAPSWTAGFETARPAGAATRPRELPLTQLAHGGRIAGRVERPDGTPWPASQVIVSLIAMNRPQPVLTYGRALTRGDGSYEIERVPAGYYVALNLGDENDPTRDPEQQVQQASVHDGETTEVSFLAPRGETAVRGVVRDADGAPLPKYKVSLDPLREETYEDWIAVEADEQGRYRFPAIPPGRYGVMIGPRFQSMTRVAIADVPEQSEFRLDLERPDGSLSGHVFDASRDVPVEGALMLLMLFDAQLGDWVFDGKADAAHDGSYSFQGLVEGRYRVVAIGVGTEYGSRGGHVIELVEGAHATQDFRLGAGGILSIVALDQDERPIADARLRVFDERGDELPHSIDPYTDIDGRLALPGLAPKRWTIEIEAEGFVSDRRTLDVVAGGTVTGRVVMRREAR